ncbi:hypothetical protein BJX70DRAFT_360902 [Aspergillus crustosus]
MASIGITSVRASNPKRSTNINLNPRFNLLAILFSTTIIRDFPCVFCLLFLSSSP